METHIVVPSALPAKKGGYLKQLVIILTTLIITITMLLVYKSDMWSSSFKRDYLFGTSTRPYVASTLVAGQITSSSSGPAAATSDVSNTSTIGPTTSPNPTKYKTTSAPDYLSPAITTSHPPEAMACKMPDLDPWDPSITEFIAHPKGYACAPRRQQEALVYAAKGYLVVNKTAYDNLDTNLNSSVTCKCCFIDITVGDEGRTARSAETNLAIDSEPIKFLTDIAEVWCTEKSTKTTIYYNLIPYPRDLTRNIEPTSDDQLSLVMMTTDSTSLSMFRRNLGKSYDYLTSVMNINIFEGYNKIADNTFPNMVAVLRGKRAYESKGMPKDYPEDDRKTTFDDWPLVWKNYSRKGYATMFNEDEPHMGMFHYLAQGFNDKPTDHYYRPYWNQWRKTKFPEHGKFCFGDEPEPELQLNMTRNHLVKYHGKRQFIFHFQAMLSHDYMNEIERLDEPFHKFLVEMNEGNHLNQSVLLVMSDHGHRFSSIRSTLIGLLEERLPIFSIYFPPWFLKIRPHIAKNLVHNRRKLTTPFDVYETLLDILAANYDGEQRPLGNRGLSMLYPIPSNRTCKSAGIPDFFCTCTESSPININSSDVQKGAIYLVERINEMLQNASQTAKLCSQLKLNKVIHAEQYVSNKKVVQGIKNIENSDKFDKEKSHEVKYQIKELRVTFSTTPSMAEFEGSVIFNTKTNLYKLRSKTISRINKYRGQADCIKDPILEKYCFCVN